MVRLHFNNHYEYLSTMHTGNIDALVILNLLRPTSL